MIKPYIQKIIQKALRKFAIKILEAHQPKIVSITGSAGKTSTKEAVFTVLSKQYRVRRNTKNYNNELGVPLTIIGAESGGRSLIGWFRVFVQARKALKKNSEYPEVLVLELGADHPGDISYLTNFIKSTVGVITNIGSTHLEFFETVDAVAKEKSVLVKKLPEEGIAVLNADDARVYALREQIRAKVITYGFSKFSDVYMQEVRSSLSNNFAISTSKIHYKGSVIPIRLYGIAGKHSMYAVMAAIAVGSALDVPTMVSFKALEEYRPPHGRMNVLSGIKKTVIIDDTYNSSKEAAIGALEWLAKAETGRKIAVLGDMLELGRATEREHRTVGEAVARSGIDMLICVGERSQDIARGAKSAGMPKDFIFHFSEVSDAGKFVQKRMEKGDSVLVKGSQGMRMEKIVKEIMAEPMRATELLVRQGPKWA